MEAILGSLPLCGTELSKVKFSEIQGKLKEQKQQELSEQRNRTQKQPFVTAWNKNSRKSCRAKRKPR